MNQLRKLKTEKDRGQLITNDLLKMIRSLRCDVYNNNKNNNIRFLNKIEVNKQYRQSVKNSEKTPLFRSVIKKLLEMQIKNMVIIHENNPYLLYDMLDEKYTKQTNF